MRVSFIITLCCLLLCCDRASTTSNKADEKGKKFSAGQPSGLDTLSKNLQDTAFARQLLEASIEAFNSQKLQKSYELADSARVLYKKLLGDHKQTAQAINQMGRCKYMQSQLGDATRLFEQACDIRRAVSGEKSKEVAQAYTNIGIAYTQWGKLEQGRAYHEKSLALKLEILEPEDPLIASSYNSLGLIYDRKADYLQAMEYYQKSRDIILAQEVIDSALLAITTGNIGNAWLHLGSTDQALSYQFKALELWEVVKYPYRENYIAGTLGNIGVAYFDTGDYQQATDYYSKALNFRETQLYRNAGAIWQLYNNLGNAYTKLHKPELACKLHEQSLSILLSEFPDQEGNIAVVYNNLGLANSELGQLQEGVDYYQRAIAITSQAKDTFSTIIYSLNLAGNLATLNDLTAALPVIEETLNLCHNKLGPYHPYTAAAYLDIGRIYYRKRKYDRALEYYGQALEACKYSRNDFKGVSSLKYTMDALHEASIAWKSKYESSKEMKYLKKAANYAEQSLSALAYQNRQFQRQGSVLLWRDQNYAFFENSIDIQLRLAAALDDEEYAWQALLTADKAKTYALREHLRDMNALSVAGIPDSLIAKEQELRTAITWREKQYQEAIGMGAQETDSFPLALSAQLADIRLAHKELKDQFEREYPEYYRLKYEGTAIDHSQLQQVISQNERSLLEYFVGDSSIYCFAVTPGGIETRKMRRDIALDTLVRQMRSGIAGMVDKTGIATDAAQQYAVAANELYKTVFSPLSDVLSASRRLVIVPDGALAYVPFDALVRSLPEDVSSLPAFDYLLKEYMISYNYSVALFLEMSSNTRHKKARKKWLGVAPSFTGQAVQDVPRFGFSPLPLNQMEVDSIQRLAGGSVLKGTDATEEAFLSAAPDYQILHLATHGYGDQLTGENSYLAFTEMPNGKEDEILFARELYDQQFNADLVVLSACETSMGQLQRGEGIISLARGFSFAGAKSMVTSLWTVSERPTVALLQEFYKQLLKEGHTKDEALWKAKRDLLSGEYQEPYYWAAFIPVGDMEAVAGSENGPTLPWWVLVTAIVAVPLLFAFWRRSKAG